MGRCVCRERPGIAGVRKLIDATTPSDEAPRSKPDPDIVHAALLNTGCRAQDAVMIGDTPYDIEAARRSGIGTIALRCGGRSDLLEHYALSPFKRPLPV
jgi:phosphoglycolate phosphatase-like HAD superfamily hydrolase